MLLFLLSIAETPEDRSKLSEIYDRYFLKMYNYAVSQLQTRSEAEDAVQEAFLSLAKNISKIDDPASRAAAGYVMTTLKNKVIDVKRKKKRDADLFNTAASENAEFDDSVFDRIVKTERTEKLNNAVKRLQSRERHIILLRLYEDMSFEDIAKLTGISEGNVKNIYYRSLVKLRTMLEDEENE